MADTPSANEFTVNLPQLLPLQLSHASFQGADKAIHGVSSDQVNALNVMKSDTPAAKIRNFSKLHKNGHEQDREDTGHVPPDGGRRAWTQVAASFLINMNVYGLVNAFGEFQNFYETEYLISYSSSTISWIGTVQGALTLFIGALAGPLFDRGHFMITLQIAAVALVFSWMMLSLSTQYYQVSINVVSIRGPTQVLIDI